MSKPRAVLMGNISDEDKEDITNGADVAIELLWKRIADEKGDDDVATLSLHILTWPSSLDRQSVRKLLEEAVNHL